MGWQVHGSRAAGVGRARPETPTPSPATELRGGRPPHPRARPRPAGAGGGLPAGGAGAAGPGGDAALRLARRWRAASSSRPSSASTSRPPPPVGPGIGELLLRGRRGGAAERSPTAAAADGRMLDLRGRSRASSSGGRRGRGASTSTSARAAMPDLFFSHRRDDGVTGRQAGAGGPRWILSGCARTSSACASGSARGRDPRRHQVRRRPTTCPRWPRRGIDAGGREPRAGAAAKQDDARRPVRAWDFIGALQSRKVKDVAPERAADPLGRLRVGAASASREPGQEVLIQVNVAGEERKAGIEPGELADYIERCPVPGHRPDDDAALRRAARGQPPPLRPPGRAGRRARPRAAVDGHEPGLRGGRAGGRDDRAPRLVLLRPPLRRRKSSIARDRRAPCQASGDLPSSSTTSSPRGSALAYSSATASGCRPSASSRMPTMSSGHVELARAGSSPRRRSSAAPPAAPGRPPRGCSWRSMRWRVASRASRASCSGMSCGLRRLHECVHAACLEPAREPSRSRSVHVDVRRFARARVGGRDLDERADPLGLLEGERHRRRGAHRAARPARRAPVPGASSTASRSAPRSEYS